MRNSTLVAVLLVASITSIVMAADREVSPIQEPATLSEQAREAMIAEIETLRLDQQGIESQIKIDLASASAEERREIARQVNESRRQYLIDVLNIRLSYAEQEGLEVMASEIRAKIAARLEAERRSPHVDPAAAPKVERRGGDRS